MTTAAATFVLILFVNCCGVDARVYSVSNNLTEKACTDRGVAWNRKADRQNFICFQRQ